MADGESQVFYSFGQIVQLYEPYWHSLEWSMSPSHQSFTHAQGWILYDCIIVQDFGEKDYSGRDLDGESDGSDTNDGMEIEGSSST